MQWNIFALPIPDDVEYEPLLPPALARLAEIQIPTLVIVGELEVPEFIGISELVTAGIAGAQKVIIPGVAHLPGLEKPELFNKIVLDFLSGQ
jgi:pimeloyl-ACP methyl ester carboxylesterase